MVTFNRRPGLSLLLFSFFFFFEIYRFLCQEKATFQCDPVRNPSIFENAYIAYIFRRDSPTLNGVCYIYPKFPSLL
jgi:hypothetical protein